MDDNGTYRSTSQTPHTIQRILKKAPQACLDNTNNAWSWQIVTSSILKLGYYLSDSQLVTGDDSPSSPELFKLLETAELLPELRVEIVSVYRTMCHGSYPQVQSSTATYCMLQALVDSLR